MKAFTATQGSCDLSQNRIFSGDQLPDQVFVVLVKQKAYNGSLDKNFANPFYFEHFHVKDACLVVNGVSEPSPPYAFNVKDNQLEMFYELMENTGTAPFEMDSLSITPEEFRTGYFIMAWDRNPVKNSRQTPRKMGGTRAGGKCRRASEILNSLPTCENWSPFSKDLIATTASSRALS